MSEAQSIQWFPGHMARTRRIIKQSLPLVDIVIEVLDARIPLSSRNPEIKKLVGDKPIISVFNKISLADPDITARWRRAFEEAGGGCAFTDCTTGAQIPLVCAFTQRQADMLMAGGLLPYTKRG